MKNHHSNLFPALSNALQSASRPMGSTELYALPQIQAHTANINRLSAYLNGMWRDGHLFRVLSPSNHIGESAWAYSWKRGYTTSRQGLDQRSRTLADRRAALITENDGEIKVEMPRLMISVPGKPVRFDYLEGLKRGMSD